GAHLVLVPLLVDVVDARREATADLVLKARSLAALELLVRAGAELEVLVDQMQRAARGRRRVVRAEVARAVGRRATHGLDARPRVRDVDAKVEVALVVAELDVVAGLVLLDEAVLQDRRFLLRRRDDR